MRELTAIELKDLPFGTNVKIVWPSRNESCKGVILVTQIAYEDGALDNIYTVCRNILNNFCKVYVS